MYAGTRLRRLRDERGLTQAALATMLELSPSYLNQLERDQRPLTVPVLLRLNSVFDLDVQFFAADTDARLIADVHDVLVESASEDPVPMAEIEELATRLPGVAHTLVAMHRRLHSATEQLEQLSAGFVGGGQQTAYEEVRDFFYDRRNHIPALDFAAEQLFEDNKLTLGSLDRQLSRVAEDRLGITVLVRGDGADQSMPKRTYDADSRTLTLARRLRPGQRAFQIATTLAFLLYEREIDSIADDAITLSDDARRLARIGLANYFAGALILPYGKFLASAEELRYDIDLLASRFDVGFETVCHRLSTLQRQGQRGVPFFFVRTDRAGNISKRQSATAFHFSRVGGSCPLWVVHDAFAHPGRMLTQVAQMPDGRRYLWTARTTVSRSGFRAPEQQFAVGLGCDIEYADRLVYSQGLQLGDVDADIPIGSGCKVCDRPACAQRAFPQVGRPIKADEHTSVDLPYP